MKLIIVPIIAILCIAGLMGYAMHLGVNGMALAGSMIIIAGLGGYEVKALRECLKKKQ